MMKGESSENKENRKEYP